MNLFDINIYGEIIIDLSLATHRDVIIFHDEKYLLIITYIIIHEDDFYQIENLQIMFGLLDITKLIQMNEIVEFIRYEI